MVDSDDNKPLLHDRTPGPEEFFLSDDQPLAPEPDQVADEGTPSVLVSCDAARTWPRQQSAPIPIGNRFAEWPSKRFLSQGARSMLLTFQIRRLW